MNLNVCPNTLETVKIRTSYMMRKVGGAHASVTKYISLVYKFVAMIGKRGAILDVYRVFII